MGDLRRRTKDEIIQYISGIKKTVIIDGLDHVENYRPEELEYFVSFIDTLKETTKVIVLSRPLKRDIHWKKQQLVNWNFEETRLVLDELYHITDHPVCKDIFDITNGYPILVRFVAEQYKHSGQIQSLGKLESTNDYYEKIISTVNTKTAPDIIYYLSFVYNGIRNFYFFGGRSCRYCKKNLLKIILIF